MYNLPNFGTQKFNIFNSFLGFRIIIWVKLGSHFRNACISFIPTFLLFFNILFDYYYKTSIYSFSCLANLIMSGLFGICANSVLATFLSTVILSRSLRWELPFIGPALQFKHIRFFDNDGYLIVISPSICWTFPQLQLIFTKRKYKIILMTGIMIA